MSMTARARRGWLVAHDPLPVVGHSTVGYDPRGSYAETYWLGLVGPSSLWLLRRLVFAARAAGPDGLDVPLGPLAAEIGLSRGVGTSSPIVSTLDRLVVFRHACIVDGVYRVNVAVPRLTEAQLARIAPHLRAVHPGVGAVIADGAERMVRS